MDYNYNMFIKNDLKIEKELNKMIDLKELRSEKGFTQEELAKECGVLRTTISMIETGENKPSVPLAQKLGEVLEVDWKGFFE